MRPAVTPSFWTTHADQILFDGVVGLMWLGVLSLVPLILLAGNNASPPDPSKPQTLVRNEPPDAWILPFWFALVGAFAAFFIAHIDVRLLLAVVVGATTCVYVYGVLTRKPRAASRHAQLHAAAAKVELTAIETSTAGAALSAPGAFKAERSLGPISEGDVSNVFRGRLAGLETVVFDCIRTFPLTKGRTGSVPTTAAVFRLQRPLPAFWVRPQIAAYWFSRPKFLEQYDLAAPHMTSARDLLVPRLSEYLSPTAGWGIECDGHWLVICRDRLSAETWGIFVAVCGEIAGLLEAR